MEEYVYLVVDYENICRLCLHSTGIMSNIFDTTEDKISIKEQIFHVTGLQVHPDDGLPTNICHKCRYIVELSSELREMASKTHRLLTNAADTNMVFNQDLEEEYTERERKQTGETNKDINLENISKQSIFKKQQTYEHDNKKENDEMGKEQEIKRSLKSLQCQICLSAFKNAKQVGPHVESHYIETNLTPYLQLKTPYMCEICENGNLSKKELITHHRVHLNINPYVCREPGCKYVGKNQDTLRHHAAVHSACTHVCERCGARFRRRRELTAHAARLHAAPARLPCRLCPVVSRNKLAHRAHLATHIHAPRHYCGWGGCTKAFRSRGALAAHTRAHAGDTRYRCRLCPAAYTSQSLLNRHSRQHSSVRARKCDQCPRAFAEYGAFYSHRVAAHGAWLARKCPACNAGYQTEAGLEKHLSQCNVAACSEHTPSPILERA